MTVISNDKIKFNMTEQYSALSNVSECRQRLGENPSRCVGEHIRTQIIRVVRPFAAGNDNPPGASHHLYKFVERLAAALLLRG